MHNGMLQHHHHGHHQHGMGGVHPPGGGQTAHPQPSPLDSQGGHSPASSSNTSQTPQTTPTSGTNPTTTVHGPGSGGGSRDTQKVCGRPGCNNPVQRNADGWISEFCSNECVVGQCQEVYTSWTSRSSTGQQPSGPNGQGPPPGGAYNTGPPQTAAVK